MDNKKDNNNGYLVIRGVELNNKNIFISYSKNFLLMKDIKKSKRFYFIGDYFYSDDLKETVDKFEEYKEWFEYSKMIENRKLLYFDILEKKLNGKQYENKIKDLLCMEIKLMEDEIEKLKKENEQLKLKLLTLEKKN